MIFPRRLVWLVVGGVVAPLYLLIAVANLTLMKQMRAGGGDDVLTARHELPQADFARFWYAGRVLSHGQNDPVVQRNLHLDLFAKTAPPAVAWLYPPTMGLLAMAASYLPLAVSFWAWRLACIAAAAGLLRIAGLGWLVIVAGLASPVAFHDLLSGQTGTLTGGLLATSLLLIERRPLLAGAVAGVLCIKPQMAFAMPGILLRRRYFPALLGFAMSVGALVVLSVVFEGARSWVWFVTVAQPAAAKVLAARFQFPLFQAGITVFMMARSLHASIGVAWLAQGISSFIGLALVWWIWRRPAEPAARMAATVSLSLLIMPYGFAYDLVGFSIAMAALIPDARRSEIPVLAALWLFPGYLIFVTGAAGVILMPVAALMGVVVAWRRIRRQALGCEQSWRMALRLSALRFW